jgi:hypothetical protein
MSNLLDKLDQMLSAPAREQTVSEQRRIQDALSGAVGEKVIVRPWVDGQLAAVVPARLFVPNGIRVVESVVPGHPTTLTGTPHAVAGAERRLAKMIGEKWGTRLVDFDPVSQAAVFTLFHHG